MKKEKRETFDYFGNWIILLFVSVFIVGIPISVVVVTVIREYTPTLATRSCQQLGLYQRIH